MAAANSEKTAAKTPGKEKATPSTPEVRTSSPIQPPKKIKTSPSKTQKILETAYSQIGKLYRYGGASPATGFDCSGFTRWVFAQHGITLPRSSGEQLHAGKPVIRKNLRPGDLLIYSRRIGRRRGTHVGIYVGNGKFIHSPRTGHRIHVSPAFDNYRTRRFIAARRVLDDPGATPLPEEQGQELARQALAHNKPRRESPKLYENTFAASYKVYHVKGGDTISGLAKRFHVPTRKLLAANQLTKRSVLQLKQRLLIPLPGRAAGTIRRPGQAGPEQRQTVKYTIKRGDTVSALAQRYGVSSSRIVKANALRSKNAIRAGQVLLIPGAAPSSPKKNISAENTASVKSTPRTTRPKKMYKVRSGDTIWTIARRHGVSSKRLLTANNLKKKHILRPGEQLVIP